MTHEQWALIEQLEAAADRVNEMPIANVQILLRRAALQLRSAEGTLLDDELDQALVVIAGLEGLSEKEMLNQMIRDWIMAQTDLAADDMDADSDAFGRA